MSHYTAVAVGNSRTEVLQGTILPRSLFALSPSHHHRRRWETPGRTSAGAGQGGSEQNKKIKYSGQHDNV